MTDFEEALARLDYVRAPTVIGRPNHIAHIAFGITSPDDHFYGSAETLCKERRDGMTVASVIPFSEDWLSSWESPDPFAPRICAKCMNAAGNLWDYDPSLLGLSFRERMQKAGL